MSETNCQSGSSTGCEKCKDGYFLNSNMECQKCHDTCKTCFGAADTQCFICKDNYYLDSNGKCVSKEQTCSFADQYGCLECSNGYFLNKNNKCEKCKITGNLIRILVSRKLSCTPWKEIVIIL